ncbi:hypothetical protein POPTR_001G082700v4 [Populus trichocarpa]|uniref:Growth-regulating factor n=1 Tax=Populus trichocarpa TaxID=3694 RepID=B9GK64_POPTR|nr:growth-regulating factor 8 isoform X2 [Populus trichocarpa]PNT53383.1 hypothetical protein POPTR_001G082700v4 [Populus trichocarpa]|eukprot:XP_002297943.1 growth-regulating factor 8 isoform X2 [Populus trichocarpa]
MRSSWSRTRSGVFVDDIGLGLRMQDNLESCSGSSKRSVTAMSCDHEPAAHELSSSSCSGGGGGSGPLFYSTSNHVTCLGDIKDVVASVSASGTGTPDAIAESKSLQYPYFISDSSPFTFNSSGEMTPSVNERVLFTAAQWQELERQTTIYKYMMASVPVPPELLIPITKNQSNVLPPRSNSSLELGIPSLNSSDAEPWRCKRTDGKKWRCSRDVAPDQKYCERHSHKSRPRSRKPVELHTHDSPRTLTNNNTNTNNSNYSTNPHLFNQKPYFPSHLFMFPSAMAPSASSYDQPRSLEWLLKGEILPVASNYSQEWQHLKRDSIKGNGKVYNVYGEEQPLCSNTYRGGHSLQAQRLNDHCSVLSSPKSTTLERALSPSLTQEQETRHFIDAWSTNSGRDDIGGIGKKSYVSSSEKLVLPHSALTLSMSPGTGSETNNEGNGSAQLSSFGIMGLSDRDHQSASGLRPQWMMSHGGSWIVSPPGGPLAEALCLGISSNAKTASNLPSPCSSSCGPN